MATRGQQSPGWVQPVVFQRPECGFLKFQECLWKLYTHSPFYLGSGPSNEQEHPGALLVSKLPSSRIAGVSDGKNSAVRETWV